MILILFREVVARLHNRREQTYGGTDSASNDSESPTLWGAGQAVLKRVERNSSRDLAESTVEMRQYGSRVMFTDGTAYGRWIVTDQQNIIDTRDQQ